MKVLTKTELVERLVSTKFKSPAHKANATRALKTYAVMKSLKTGSSPSRFVAGIKAAVTKRIK